MTLPQHAGPGCPAPLLERDHGRLSGLTDDDHPGYARLTGRAGSQTLNGGTAASESLTLQSTSHATKGDIDIPAGERIHLGDSAARPPINITARNTPPTTPAVGDLYLDDGTNTTTGAPGWRWCQSLGPPIVWWDISPLRFEMALTGIYRHVEGAVPVENEIGGVMLNAARLTGLNVTFWALISWVVAGACTLRVRLYDYGASPGPPGAPPTLVATMDNVLVGASADGPLCMSQALLVDAAGPALNTIDPSARLYRAVVTIVGGTVSDVVFVEGGGLALR